MQPVLPAPGIFFLFVAGQLLATGNTQGNQTDYKSEDATYVKANCDFQRKQCGWGNRGSTGIKWLRQRSVGNYYMSADMSKGEVSSTARLVSPWFRPTESQQCTLQFRYYFGRDNSCQLSVVQQTATASTEIWSTRRATGLILSLVQPPIKIPPSNCRHRIMFEARKLKKGNCGVEFNEVQVDDIEFRCSNTSPDTSSSTSPDSSPNTSPYMSSNTSPDTSSNKSPDTPSNTSPETSPSTSSDTSSNAAPETPYNKSPETSSSTSPDTTSNTSPDTSSNTSPETSPSTSSDTSSNTSPDTSLYTSPDTSSNTSPDTSSNTSPDTSSNTSPDTPSNTSPDTSSNTSPGKTTASSRQSSTTVIRDRSSSRGRTTTLFPTQDTGATEGEVTTTTLPASASPSPVSPYAGVNSPKSGDTSVGRSIGLVAGVVAACVVVVVAALLSMSCHSTNSCGDIRDRKSGINASSSDVPCQSGLSGTGNVINTGNTHANPAFVSDDGVTSVHVTARDPDYLNSVPDKTRGNKAASNRGHPKKGGETASTEQGEYIRLSMTTLRAIASTVTAPASSARTYDDVQL